MPSSQRKDTAQEGRLRSHYKHAYARLLCAREYNHANSLTSLFVQLLESTDATLKNGVMDDPKYWNNLTSQFDKIKASDNIWWAGEKLADVGTVLFEFGRNQEGNFWCGLAEELRTKALEQQQQENHYNT